MSTTASTQRCKVNLERLLRCCERLADEMRTESDRRRLLTYLSVLERYWHELDAARCNAAVLAEYRRKIEHIGDLLDDEKMLAGSGGALARSRLRNHTTLSREQANSELASRLNAASRVQQELRSQLMHHVEGAPPTADEPASLPDGHAGVEVTRGGGAPRVATAAVATGPTTVATSTAAAAVAAAASLGSGASIGGRAAARVAGAREALLLPGGGAAAPLTPTLALTLALTLTLTLSLTLTLTLSLTLTLTLTLTLKPQASRQRAWARRSRRSGSCRRSCSRTWASSSPSSRTRACRRAPRKWGRGKGRPR